MSSKREVTPPGTDLMDPRRKPCRAEFPGTLTTPASQDMLTEGSKGESTKTPYRQNPGEGPRSPYPGRSNGRRKDAMRKSPAFSMREKTEYIPELDFFVKLDSSGNSLPNDFWFSRVVDHLDPPEEDPIVVLGWRASFRIGKSRYGARISGIIGTRSPGFPLPEKQHSRAQKNGIPGDSEPEFLSDETVTAPRPSSDHTAIQ